MRPVAAIPRSRSRNTATRKRVCRSIRSAPRSVSATGSRLPTMWRSKSLDRAAAPPELVVERQYLDDQSRRAGEMAPACRIGWPDALRGGRALRARTRRAAAARRQACDGNERTESPRVRMSGSTATAPGVARSRFSSVRRSASAAPLVGTSTAQPRAASGSRVTGCNASEIRTSASSVPYPAIESRAMVSWSVWRSGTRSSLMMRGVITVRVES